MPAASPSTTDVSSAVTVRTPGRLHLGMISFGNPAVPSFGGVGVMVDSLGVALRLRRADTLRGNGPLADRAVEFARRCAAAWSLGDVGCTIDVVAAPRSHVGLGSGTQLALAVAAGMRQLFRAGAAAPGVRRFAVAEALELAAAVERGRRSCVGIYGFAGGGLIAEAGRLEAEAGGRFSPLVARVHLPEAWRCVVLVQRDVEGLHGAAEKEAFAMLQPVSAEVSAALTRIAADELLPAAARGEFAVFSDAVHRYGRLAGRPFESQSSRLPFHGAINALIDLAGHLGFRGAAQSSWGPAVMVCCESAAAAERLGRELASRGVTARCDVFVTRFDREGAGLAYTSP